MQVPLYTIPGGKPKQRVGYLPALLACSLAAVLPVRLRLVFTFALNFIHNHVLATLRLILFSLGWLLTHALIAMTYYLVLGPLAVAARLLGRDYLSTAPRPGSWFSAKEPADETEARFLRQY